MKRTFAWLLCLMMMFTAMAPATAETIFTAGTYEGEGNSFGGKVRIAVTVSETTIEKIEVLEHSDSAGVSDPAYAKLPQAIIDGQSIAVDTIAGCTMSSNAIIEAVKAALLASGATEEAISKEITKNETVKELETKSADVIVIGSGGAGMSAAVEVIRAGGSVLVVDKLSSVGGNTIVAGSALNASCTDIQKAGTITATGIDAIEELLALEPQNDDMKRWQESIRKDLDAYIASGSTYVFDSADLHKLQTYVGGDYVAKTELIEVLGNNAPLAIEFLSELGTQWKPDITAAVGATWQRSHQPTNSFGPSGSDFVLPQVGFVKENGGEFALERRAEELIVEDGRVVGVKGTGTDGTPFEYRASKGVIMATGGFAANVEMRQKYNKHWADLGEGVICSNIPGAVGDGIVMADAIGANLVGMEWIQLVTGGGNISASVANNMFINALGDRFVAEDERRDVLSNAVLSQPGQFFWWLTDGRTAWDIQGGYDYAGKSINELVESGKLKMGETIEELAQNIGVDPAKLQAAVDTFNKSVAGEADPFGRKLFEYPFDKGPYYAGASVAVIHHTMGGIEINENCQVLDVNGNVIPGFFAAGEVTGGIHGSNRLGGNAIADIIVFGRVAGQNAMK